MNECMNAMEWNGTELNERINECMNEGTKDTVNITEISLLFGKGSQPHNSIVRSGKHSGRAATGSLMSTRRSQAEPHPTSSQAPACHESPRLSWPLLVVLEPPVLNVSLAAQDKQTRNEQT